MAQLDTAPDIPGEKKLESNSVRPGFWQRLAGIGERFRASTAAWVTIMTAIVSAAVPATEAARGWSAQQMKDAETRSIIAQKELDQKATLATSYLDRLAKPDLKSEDRLMYLSALAQLEQHPLRIWALDEQAKQAAELTALAKLATQIQQSVDARREAQTELDRLEGEIDVAKLKLAQAKSFADFEAYRKGLLDLNHRRNIMRASADLSGLMGEYRNLVASGVPSVLGVVLGDASEKFRKVSAQATEISRRATENQTKIAALRLAAVAAWDADDVTTAGEAANEAVQLCGAEGKPFRSDRDCTLITFAQVLSAFRMFTVRRNNNDMDAAFREADKALRAAYPLRERLALSPPIKPSEGTESGRGHVRNVISVVGCWVYEVRSDPKLQSRADRLYGRQEALLKTIEFGYAKPEETCGNLPGMNTIWP